MLRQDDLVKQLACHKMLRFDCNVLRNCDISA